MKRHIKILLIFLFCFSFLSKAQDTAKIISTSPIEVFPSFPGGDDALMKFVIKNRHYENAEDRNQIGIVKVTFVIEKDGSILEPKIVQAASGFYDKEAIRIVKAMPKWKPGTQNGIPVSVQYTLPIKF